MRRRHRPDGERGAVLVEFAMVALIIVTLVAGTFDLGRGWSAGLRVNEAARTGARIGSGQGRVQTADFSILSGVRAALESSNVLPHVDRVVIFQAGTTGKVPDICKTGTPPSTTKCNIVTGAQLTALPATSTGAITSTGCLNASTSNWCPTTRTVVQLNADYIGVYVRIRQPNMFRVLGSSVLVERTAVMRLEPEETP